MKSLQLAGSALLAKDRAFFGVSRFVCLRRSVYDSRQLHPWCHAIIGQATVRACGFARNAQLSTTCEELLGNRSALVFSNLIEEFPRKNGERDENEKQNQWLYDSQRRVQRLRAWRREGVRYHSRAASR